MDLLRFITAGSVDDGKSTLIGRLLFDSKNILVDQLESIKKTGTDGGVDEFDLARLTDGLRAEREQGITIDVAYKYFSTPKRKFIISDAPGHIQYTRNMITGASNTSLIIILVDARNGIAEQTKRHSLIASLLNIPHVVVAVNKLDLVNYSQSVFDEIVSEYETIAEKLSLQNVTYIPISALAGDNVVDSSDNLSWYKGKTLLDFLETVEVNSSVNLKETRFPIQYVIRPQTDDLHDYRGYAGKITAGIYHKGDEVVVLPFGLKSTIDKIEIGGNETDTAFAPQSVILHLKDDVEAGRGNLIVKADKNLPATAQEFEAFLCWMHNAPLQPGNRFLLQINSTIVKAIVKEFIYKLDVNKLEEVPADNVKLNDIVYVKIKTAQPFVFDKYNDLSIGGGFILIDETSYLTVAAGMVQ